MTGPPVTRPAPVPPSPLADEARQDGDERRPLAELFRDLRTSRAGLEPREAARRLVVHGPNELTRRGGPHWPRQLLAQFHLGRD